MTSGAGIDEESSYQERLNSCIESLESATKTEEIMVALLILPKVFKPTDLDNLPRVFSAINWKFIHKMLNSWGNKDLMVIGLRIWTTFTTFPQLISKRQLLKRIPACCKFILNAQQNLNSEANGSNINNSDSKAIVELKELVIQSFLNICQSDAGALALLADECLECFVALIDSSSESDELKSKVLNLIERLADKVTNLTNEVNYGDPSFAQLDQDDVADWNSRAEALPVVLLEPLAVLCKLSISSVKFQAMDVCVKLFCCSPGQSSRILAMQNKSSMLTTFRSSLKQVVKSKLSKSQRESTLMLAGMLCQTFGTDWMIPPSTYFSSKNPKGHQQQYTNGQFITILAHMVCAEVRVILDCTEKYLKLDARMCTLLPMCYTVIDIVIKLLVQESEDDEKEEARKTFSLDYDLLMSIRRAMHETFVAVVSFLVERYDYYILEIGIDAKSSEVSIEDTKTAFLQMIDNTPTIDSLRAYCSYVAEESEVSTTELDRILPLVILLLDENQCVSCSVPPVWFLTPLISIITSSTASAEEDISDHSENINICQKFCSLFGLSKMVRIFSEGINNDDFDSESDSKEGNHVHLTSNEVKHQITKKETKNKEMNLAICSILVNIMILQPETFLLALEQQAQEIFTSNGTGSHLSSKYPMFLSTLDVTCQYLVIYSGSGKEGETASEKDLEVISTLSLLLLKTIPLVLKNRMPNGDVEKELRKNRNLYADALKIVVRFCLGLGIWDLSNSECVLNEMQCICLGSLSQVISDAMRLNRKSPSFTIGEEIGSVILDLKTDILKMVRSQERKIRGGSDQEVKELMEELGKLIF